MSLIPGRQVAVSLNYIMPDTKYTDSGTSTFAAFGNGGQGGEDALVPAFYGSWMINPQWSVGLGINAPFGLATEWDSSWAGQFHAVRSEVQTLNINPVVAYKVNNMISLGAGLSYQQLKGEFTQAANAAGTVQGKIEGDEWDWGWNVGALFDFGQGTRMGLTYRSTISYDLKGDLTVTGLPAVTPVRTDIKLPSTFSVGLSHQFNPQTRILADWTWTKWDTIQNLDFVVASGPGAGTPVSRTALRFDNSWRIGAGIEYQLNQPWLLRAGIAYDTTPVQDAFRTPRLPDEDRTWLAVGARFQPAPTWWLDFGYTHIWLSDAASQLNEPAPPTGRGSLNGKYKASIDILGVQAVFKF
jgi:long-chain fatty acid transport protein